MICLKNVVIAKNCPVSGSRNEPKGYGIGLAQTQSIQNK